MKNILIFRSEVLPNTQTFILAQAKSMSKFRPCFVGLAPSIDSLSVDGIQQHLLTQNYTVFSKLQKAAYRITGYSPTFHDRIRRLNGQLVHAHFAEDGPVAMSLASSLKLPLVVTLHGGAETINDRHLRNSLRYLLYTLRRKRVWQYAAKFICVSQYIADIAAEVGYPKDKLVVHYIGVNTKYFSPCSSVSHSPKMVLFVGRLAEKKGVTFLLSAMSKVQEHMPDASLILIGDGPERKTLELQANALGINATFFGAQSQDVILKFLRQARVFCGPSITAKSGDREGLPTVFAEAQAAGLPAIGTKHSGIPEVILDGAKGLLAPEADSQYLAELLLKVLSDSYPWLDVRDRGVEWIHSKFDIEKQTQALEDIYEDVIERTVAANHNK